MEDEDKEIPEPKEPEKTEEMVGSVSLVPEAVSIVDEAKAIRDEIRKEKVELKMQNDRKEKLQTDELLSSTAGGNIAPVEKPKETDEEFTERVEKGEVNLLGEDVKGDARNRR